MDVPGSLKKTNPQKYYMKMICNGIYYLGFGNSWYETRVKSTFQTRIYLFWAAISNLYTFGFFFNEFLANCRTDLNDKEQNDLVQFTLAHLTISGKIIFNYIYKKDIIIVLERLLESGRATFVDAEVDKACVKRFLTLSIMVVGVSYITLFAATVDGIKVYFTEGIPIRTEVVFYPTSSNSGIFVNIIRFLAIFHWFYAVAIMVLIDCLCIGSLVIAGHKFKVLQVYFKGLSENLDVKGKTKETQMQYREKFVVGIKMHEEALWCAKNVQSALGNLYSVQVFESVVLLVMCLLKLVRVERNLVFLLANFAYILCLIVITGAYMMAGGDITHEAAEVSTAIYQSGWEQLAAIRDIRVLTVLALQRSQVPVYMFAFGMMTLSYNNFISVIRSSYSFFAVMY